MYLIFSSVDHHQIQSMEKQIEFHQDDHLLHRNFEQLIQMKDLVQVIVEVLFNII